MRSQPPDDRHWWIALAVVAAYVFGELLFGGEMNLDLLLKVAALVVFVLAAAGVSSPRVGLVPLGLALLTLTLLI
jgi:hypothetical protein